MDTICISLGGSIVSRKNGVNISYIRKFYKLISKYRKKYRFIITVGGGYATRLYVNSSRSIIKNELVLDEIAIAITRINALFVKDMLSDLDVYPNIVTDMQELRMAAKLSSIVVLGGLLPGLTTDSVAVLACEVVGSKTMINVSENAFVFDKLPTEKGAKKLNALTHETMVKIAAERDSRMAGSNFVFDLVASKLSKRGNIEVRFVNDDVNELEKAITNKKYQGSVVKN